jgi:hypothetical protein
MRVLSLSDVANAGKGSRLCILALLSSAGCKPNRPRHFPERRTHSARLPTLTVRMREARIPLIKSNPHASLEALFRTVAPREPRFPFWLLAFLHVYIQTGRASAPDNPGFYQR